MSNSPYFSTYFLHSVWPKFSATLKTDRTRKNYLSDFSMFADFIQKDILAASPADAQSYIYMLLERKANGKIRHSTIQKKYKQLNSFYTYVFKNTQLFDQLQLEEHPFSSVILEMEEERIPYNSVLKVSDMEKLVQYLSRHDTMCLCAVLLSYEGMLRLQELISLRVSDIVIDASDTAAVQVIRKKETRYNKISDNTFHTLCSYINSLGGKEFLFSHHSKEGCYSMRTLQKRLQKACHECGISNFSFNDLRNTAITFALSGGAELETVTDALGYRSTGHITRLTSAVLKTNNACDFIERYTE